MTTFADAFERAKGQPIDYEGRKVQLSYWLPVSDGDHVGIKFLRYASTPVQGLGLTAERCQLRVVSITSSNVVLWTDTAPRDVEIRVVKAKPGARLGLMNQWRDAKYGTTLMGINNAAMEFQPQSDGSVVLRCSDGWGEPDFNDLVVRLRVGRQR